MGDRGHPRRRSPSAPTRSWCRRSRGRAPLRTVRGGASTRPMRSAPTDIWAMIETPKALLHLPAIAGLADDAGRAARRLRHRHQRPGARRRVCRSPTDRAAYVPWFTQIVAAARAYGLDGDRRALQRFPRSRGASRRNARQARALGMDGKTLIHPDQIEAANRIFSPTAEELRRGGDDRRRLRPPGESAERPSSRSTAAWWSACI